jgi:hypothetical protein
LRTLILIFTTIALITVAYWAHLHFNLGIEVTAAVVALVGAAAAVVAMYPLRARGGCDVANPYLTISRLDDKGEFIVMRMEAHVLNTNEQRDALIAVKHIFYRRDGESGAIHLTFGARKIDAPMGQTLPCPLEPGITYFVEGRDHYSTQSPLGKFVLGSPHEDFTLRCRFVFRHARSITLRVRPFSSGDKPGRLRSRMTELLFVSRGD